MKRLYELEALADYLLRYDEHDDGHKCLRWDMYNWKFCAIGHIHHAYPDTELIVDGDGDLSFDGYYNHDAAEEYFGGGWEYFFDPDEYETNPTPEEVGQRINDYIEENE